MEKEVLDAMIPILYDEYETDFTSNGLGALSDAVSVQVTEERNGMFEVEMVYPSFGVHFADLELDRYIKVKASSSTTRAYQIFRIYSITKPINRKCTIRAQHVSYQMLHIPLMPFTAAGASNTMDALRPNSIGDNPFHFYTDNPSTRQYNLYYPKSLRGALQGDQWSILQNFGGDYEWDNFDVHLWVRRGVDTYITLRYGVDIIDIKQEDNIQKTYCGIVPYWYGVDGDKESLVVLPEEVMWASTAANFPYSRALCVDMTPYLSEKPTVAQLRAAGQDYIDRNEIGYPAVSISVNFIDLSQTEEYKDIPLKTLEIGDSVTVEFSELNIKKQARISRVVYDVLKERTISLFIGENYHSLASIIADQTAATQNLSVDTGNKIASSLSNFLHHADGSVLPSITIPSTGQYRLYKPSVSWDHLMVSVEIVQLTSTTGAFEIMTQTNDNHYAYLIGAPGTQIDGLQLRWIYV